MIKAISEKFGTMTVDFKCIINKDEVVVFMMPVFHDKNSSIKPLKFKGSPDTIDEQIRNEIKSMGTDIVESVSDYDSFLKSLSKAKTAKVKSTKPKTVKDKLTETAPPAQPSLF
jgi:hypothetical protein